MKISLNTEINIKVVDNSKQKDDLTIFIREYTKKEKKEMEGLLKKFQNLIKKINKLSKKNEMIDKKIHYAEEMDDFKKATKLLDEQEKLDAEIEAIGEEVEKLGGDDFAEEMAKKSFDTLISGNDKEKLREYAETKGYKTIMDSIFSAKVEAEKKQSGE